jgi:hypothetical protein
MHNKTKEIKVLGFVHYYLGYAFLGEMPGETMFERELVLQ